MCSSIIIELLEAVHLDLVFLCQANFDEELGDVGPLVSLELDHLTVLRVVHHCTIASKLLYKLQCVCVCACIVSNGEHNTVEPL